MIVLNYPQTTISFENWEKFILPFLQKQTVGSMILYKMEQEQMRLRTFMDGFVIVTFIAISKIKELYADAPTNIGLEPPPDTSGSELLNKFNQDYMDGRGIPELE